jgi:hypothetical protein
MIGCHDWKGHLAIPLMWLYHPKTAPHPGNRASFRRHWSEFRHAVMDKYKPFQSSQICGGMIS